MAGKASLAQLVLLPDIELRRKRRQAAALQNGIGGARFEMFARLGGLVDHQAGDA
jgi:hypothetical protein